MSHEIADIAALEACIGKRPGAVDLKVIDHLDAGALRWIASSPLLFAAFVGRNGIRATVAGGGAGFVRADADSIEIPTHALDDANSVEAGQSFGSLFLLPGIGETLRVNGEVIAASRESVRVAVRECFAHCAKALMRSQFWAAHPSDAPAADHFIAESRFMVVATSDAENRVDVSPKGDPAGLMTQIIEGDLIFAERPGNRRTDSLRNILAHRSIAAMLLCPGSQRVMQVIGAASISSDPDLRARFAVDGKTPALTTRITSLSSHLQDSAALKRARLWPAGEPTDGIVPADLFADHVRLNKAKSLEAGIAKAMVAIPGAMQAALRHDYKNNLY